MMVEERPGLGELLAEHWRLLRDLRKLQIKLDAERCKGTWECYQVCPVGCWSPDYERRKVVFHDPALCIACGACVLQCPEDAIELRVP
jgi:NAD-dependent dihydropyrimidine dehydrogenase PreA subunit